MSQPESRVLEASAGPGVLTEIARVLDETWSAHPEVPEAIRMQMNIAAGEIGANIVEHAAQGRPVPIRMEVSVLTDEVAIAFTDGGVPAVIDLDSVSFPDELAERGRGLPLSKAALAELSYRRDSANHWRLVSQRFA